MIELEVSRTSACCVGGRETLTSGRVGLKGKATFSPEWQGLIKTAVVTGSGQSIDTLVDEEGLFTVPHECMTQAGTALKIGLYGMNEAGTVVIPTVYASVGIVQKGAVPTGQTGAEPTPTAYGQLLATVSEVQGYAKEALDCAEKAKDYASEAAESVANGKYVSTYIGEDGNLYFVRTDNAEDISLTLDEEGKLVMEIG